MDEGRARKLADRIVQIVAEMLERRVKDPRLGFVTVTDARVSGDLREATVYYTVYGSEDEQAGTATALKSATGLIRSEVGRQTGLKHTPSLSFIRDTIPEGAAHMEELVAQARAADEAVAAAREGAEPAGDPDPYRVPASQADDDEDDEFPDEDDLGDEELYDDEPLGGSFVAGDFADGVDDAGASREGALGRDYPAAPRGNGGIPHRRGASRWRR